MNISRLNKFFLLILLSPFYLPGATLAAFSEGTLPLGSEADLVAIAASDSKYVAVGRGSEVFHSYDGITWIKQTLPDNGMEVAVFPGVSSKINFRDIAYGNGIFIAVAEDHRAYYSPDGENWSFSNLQSYSPTTRPDLSAIVFTGTDFYVAANHAEYDPIFDQTAYTTAIHKTSNGINWADVGDLVGYEGNAMGWDGANALIGTTDGRILSGPNLTGVGQIWASLRSPLDPGTPVTAFASNQSDLTFVTAYWRNMATSPNGVDWTLSDYRTTDSPVSILSWNDVIWDGSEFMLIDDNGLISSTSDGITWTEETTFQGQMSLQDIAFIGNQKVIIGKYTDYLGNITPKILYSGTSVSPTNVPPTVDAGSDQTVTANTTVTLSGTATDSDGAISSYIWQQVVDSRSPVVTLSATDAIDTSFTAPDVTQTTSLTFRFYAIDDANSASNDTVTITVNPVTATDSTTVTSEDSSSGGGGGALNLLSLMLFSLLLLNRRIVRKP